MVASLFGLGRLPGISRPAIGTVLPGLDGPKLLVDAGANTECKAENLLQFALMGSVYAENIGIKIPVLVWLVMVVNLLKEMNLHLRLINCWLMRTNKFYGNVEGRDFW